MDPFDLRLWPGFLKASGNINQPAFVDQITIDSRRIDPAYTNFSSLFVPLPGKFHDGHHFIVHAAKSGAKWVLARHDWIAPLDPILDQVTILRVDDPLKAFQEIASTYRMQKKCFVIAIAGSFGKTMVKDLLLEILKTTHKVAASPESFNSQIGVALSLLTITDEHDIALIEAGISLKGEMDLLCQMIHPNATIITRIGKKHTTTLGSIEEITGEIAQIASHDHNQKWAIIPNDPLLKNRISTKKNLYFWNEATHEVPHAHFTSEEANCKIPYRIDFPDGHTFKAEVTSGFYYFLDLINITIKAAWLLKTPSKKICQVLRKYTAEPMRTEIWRSPTGATFINEPYCSDPQSVELSFEHFKQSQTPERKTFMFGGLRGDNEHKESAYRHIAKSIIKAKIDRVILYGTHCNKAIIDELKSLSKELLIEHYKTAQEALNAIKDNLLPNDYILIKGENKLPIDLIIGIINDSVSSNQCIINLAAIAQNIATIRHKLPPKTRIMVMVKALAYGTDEVRVAKFLESQHIDILGVSYADEGVALKRAGVKQSIFVINAANYEAAKVVKWGLEVGVSDGAFLEALSLEAIKQNKIIKVHLHVDTGMGRFGCRPEASLKLAMQIQNAVNIELDGIMTHFAAADDPSHDQFTKSQANMLQEVIEELEAHGICPKWRHAANSSGAVRFSFPFFNMVRIGLSIYGLYPSKAAKESLELRLAISLISRIVGINKCKKDESISYGRSYIIEKETQNIAVLPIGYFDGLHRNYSGKSSVIIHGQQAPMVGKICMDFMMVDVTNIKNASPGDPVLIFGEDEHDHYLSPEALATSGNSITHELITCLGPRIQRIFVHEEAHLRH